MQFRSIPINVTAAGSTTLIPAGVNPILVRKCSFTNNGSGPTTMSFRDTSGIPLTGLYTLAEGACIFFPYTEDQEIVRTGAGMGLVIYQTAACSLQGVLSYSGA